MTIRLTPAKLKQLRADLKRRDSKLPPQPFVEAHSKNIGREFAQFEARKAKRAANQRKADERLGRLIAAVEKWLGKVLIVAADSAVPPMHNAAVKEYRFSDRRWKFDLAFPYVKVAIEVSGGKWSVTGRDRANECERMNEAQIAGWIVLEFGSDQIDEKAEWCSDAVRRAFARNDEESGRDYTEAEVDEALSAAKPVATIGDITITAIPVAEYAKRVKAIAKRSGIRGPASTFPKVHP